MADVDWTEVAQSGDARLAPFFRGFNEGSGSSGGPPQPDPGAGGDDRRADNGSSGGGDVRQAARQLWLDAGYSPAAVTGIMRRVDVESGFNPQNIGDGGTSFGWYQHHGSRAKALSEYATSQGGNPGDPLVQTKFAIAEMSGGDPIASRSRQALMAAKSPDDAYRIFTAGFERPKGSEAVVGPHLVAGPFTGDAKSLIEGISRRMEESDRRYNEALKSASSLREYEATLAKQQYDRSMSPPKNMHDAWSQWSSSATILALLGGLGGRRGMTAALSAAGAMLEGANQADQKSYDKAYQTWKDQSEAGLKYISFLHTEARDIVADAKGDYDRMATQLATLSAAHQLAQALDPNSVENLGKELTRAKDRAEIINLQNVDSATRIRDADWLKEHPEANGTVPPDVHNQHAGQAKHEAAGTGVATGVAMSDDDARFAARQYLAGDRSVLSGLGYGNTGASNRAKVRSAIRAEAEAQGLSPEGVATKIAEFEGLKAGERTVGTVGARIGMGAAEAAVFAPMVLEASDKVDRTQYPTLNSVLLAYEQHTGDENVVRFGIALNALQNAYSQVLVRGGAPTDAARATAKEVFDRAYSQGQMRVAVDQVMKEIKAAQQAPGMVRQEMRGGTAPSGAPSGGAAGLPEGVPTGSRQIGTYQGHPVYETPDGRRLQVQ